MTMILIDCGFPVPPTCNGNIGGHSNSSEGASVTFQCNDGYFPSTERTSICTGDGWSPLPADNNCTLLECAPTGKHMLTIIGVEIFYDHRGK